MVNQRDIIRHYEQNEAAALRLVQQYDELVDELGQTLEELRTRAGAARTELAVAYLAAVTRADLDRAEKITGFRGFSRRDPVKAMEREARVLQRTIAEVEADERYRKRAILVGVGGTLTQAVDEAKEMLAPWATDCARFEDLPAFLDLVDMGYDTPDFHLEFWQPAYWTAWAQGDAVCEALEMEDFGDDVLPAWRVVAGHRAVWRKQVADAEAKVLEVHELARVRDQAEGRLPQLPAVYLEHCHQQLAGYFKDADLSLLEQWLRNEGPEPDRGVLMALRKAAGAAAKVKFLRELVDEGVKPALDSFRQRKSKFVRKAVKYQRGKYYGTQFPNSALDRGFTAKLPKYQERPDKIRGLARRLAEYDDYARFDLAHNEEEAWFSEMTRKSPPSLLPRTRRWYDRQGTVAVQHDDLVEATRHDALAEAAAAVAAADDLGYLS